MSEIGLNHEVQGMDATQASARWIKERTVKKILRPIVPALLPAAVMVTFGQPVAAVLWVAGVYAANHVLN